MSPINSIKMTDLSDPNVIMAWATIGSVAAGILVGILTIIALFCIAKRTANQIKQDQLRLLRLQTAANVQKYIWGATDEGKTHQCGEQNVRLVQELNKAKIVFAGTAAERAILIYQERKTATKLLNAIEAMSEIAGFGIPNRNSTVFGPSLDNSSCPASGRASTKKTSGQ